MRPARSSVGGVIGCLRVGLASLALALTAAACASSSGGAASGADGLDGGADVEIDAAGPDGLTDDPALVRVATFNVRRFFDDVCDSGRCEEGDFEEAPTPENFAYHANQLARAIVGLEADVVLLQEVENQRCLDALSVALEERYPVAVLGEQGYPGSMDVAILARGELAQVVTHQDTPIPLPGGGVTTFSRELLELHLDVEGRALIVIDAHFRSKYSDDPERRLAEGRAARVIVDAVALEHPEALVVFGGDLNDTPGSPALNELEVGAEGLFRVDSQLPPGEAWTIFYAGTRQDIDHLYLPAADRDALLPSAVSVVRGPAGFGYGGSDHAALRAIFRLKDR